jgi:hypothetical protein
MSYIYSHWWPQLNAGYTDFWMFSNHQSMVIFSHMYTYLLEKAFKLESQYIKDFSNWPDSNIANELSNEVLLKRSVPVKNTQYNLNCIYNLHLLIKHYIIASGLYPASKFIRCS